MNKDIEKKIKLILNVILDEIETNEKFQKRFLEIFDINPDKEIKSKKKNNRRDKPVLNPITIIQDNNTNIRYELEKLSIKELKDIIAYFNMDKTKVAMKWKNKEKIINLIIEISTLRASKGSAFM